MRTHLRSAALSIALLSLAMAAVPAQAHSTSPPGASVQASARELVTVQAFDITIAVPVLVSADAWLVLQAPQVHAEHASDVAHAFEASSLAVQRQRARAPSKSRLTSQGSRFHYALSKRPIQRTGRRFIPDEHAAG